MDFRYTVDPNAAEPIMLLDSHIGLDAEDGEGIMADQFCRELLLLDTMNKSKINVWINSPGGSVVDGMQIFNTILKTRTKVDTHNVGMAASIAAPIFLAGRNRYMMDNAVMMVHPVSGGDEDSRKVFEGCVNSMISSRSFLTPQTVQGMMTATTWLDAVQCEAMGLCTKEASNDFNKQRSKPDLSNVSNAYKAYKQIVNSAISNLKTTNKMSDLKLINNKLEINEDAAPSATVKAIDALVNKANEAEIKEAKVKADLIETENKLTALKADYDKIVAENNASKEAELTAKLEAAELEAKVTIENAVKVGKIANKAEVIEMWSNSFKISPENTKAMLEAIPLNKKGASLPETTNTVANESALTMVAAMEMAEIKNKLKL